MAKGSGRKSRAAKKKIKSQKRNKKRSAQNRRDDEEADGVSQEEEEQEEEEEEEEDTKLPKTPLFWLVDRLTNPDLINIATDRSAGDDQRINDGDRDEFTVVSYNVLANVKCRLRGWPDRSKVVLNILKFLMPDIICLQGYLRSIPNQCSLIRNISINTLVLIRGGLLPSDISKEAKGGWLSFDLPPEGRKETGRLCYLMEAL